MARQLAVGKAIFVFASFWLRNAHLVDEDRGCQKVIRLTRIYFSLTQLQVESNFFNENSVVLCVFVSFLCVLTWSAVPFMGTVNKPMGEMLYVLLCRCIHGCLSAKMHACVFQSIF